MAKRLTRYQSEKIAILAGNFFFPAKKQLEEELSTIVSSYVREHLPEIVLDVARLYPSKVGATNFVRIEDFKYAASDGLEGFAFYWITNIFVPFHSRNMVFYEKDFDIMHQRWKNLQLYTEKRNLFVAEQREKIYRLGTLNRVKALYPEMITEIEKLTKRWDIDKENK